jgi:hypothetical protein
MKQDQWLQRGGDYLSGVGRFNPGATVESASADLNTIARRLQQAYPDSTHQRDTVLAGLQEF